MHKTNNSKPARDVFQDVKDFQEKFGVPMLPSPGMPVPELTFLKIRHLYEELHELQKAAEAGDLPELFDGLIDLVYVALGFAANCGFPFYEGWAAVQAANMAKERALRPEDSKRGSTYDIVKPEGWTPPDIRGILSSHADPQLALNF